MNKFIAVVFCILTLVAYTNCGGGSGFSDTGSGDTSTGTTPGVDKDSSVNALSIYRCTNSLSYVNEPCVTVTICTPGTTTCQTIPNILLDTGSYGLRLVSSVVTTSLTQVTDGSGNSIAECISYMDGTEQWGPVQRADITLGGETASDVPIQIINGSYGHPPTPCSSPQSGTDVTEFNGIMGVGLFAQDCGATCVTSTTPQTYYSCTASACSAAKVALTDQVANPVAMMPTDNNGVILSLPAIANSGATTVSGTMYMGIGTRTNNTLSPTMFFQTDTSGDFNTTFNGTNYNSAFIDSGSNGLFFPTMASIPDCGASTNAPGFFCPTSDVDLTATVADGSNANPQTVSFTITNADSAFAATNPYWAFNDIGADTAGTFDWGLPFFFGRNVHVGFEGTSSNLGSGTYWAF